MSIGAGLIDGEFVNTGEVFPTFSYNKAGTSNASDNTPPEGPESVLTSADLVGDRMISPYDADAQVTASKDLLFFQSRGGQFLRAIPKWEPGESAPDYKWQFDQYTYFEQTTPIYDGDHLYIPGEAMYKLDPETGEVLASNDTRTLSVPQKMTHDSDRVVVPNINAPEIVIFAKGDLSVVDTVDLAPDAELGGVVLDDSGVVYGMTESRVFQYDGSLTTETINAGSVGDNTHPVVADGVVYVPEPDNQQMLALDAGDFTELWSTGSLGVDVYAPATVGDGTVLVTENFGAVHLYEAGADGGSELWTDSGGYFHGATYVDGVYYAVDDGIFALSESDGSVLWKYTDDPVNVRPTAVDGYLYATAPNI